MLVPYTDAFYYSRRPTLAIPAGTVLQIGSDSSGKPLGLHPKLTGLKDIFNQGRLALIQRVGYENSSRSHFSGTDIWSTANPSNTTGSGWVGRYLATLPPPLDPLVAWNTTGDTPHALQSPSVSVASIPSVSGYAFNSPNTGNEAVLERSAAASIASHVPVDKPHVAFVSTTAQAAMATLDRVASVGQYKPSVTYPNNGFGQALQAIAGAMAKDIGTKVFWVQTGGFDTHASQDTTADAGAYVKLMVSLNDGLSAFYNDMKNLGLMNDTLVLSFSEFGRRVTENGSKGHRSRRGERDARDGRRRARRAVRDRGVAQPGSAEPDAREQQRRRALRDRLPVGLREGDRQLARRRLGRRPRRELQEERARLRLKLQISDFRFQIEFQTSDFELAQPFWRASSSASWARSHVARVSCSAASARAIAAWAFVRSASRCRAASASARSRWRSARASWLR